MTEEEAKAKWCPFARSIWSDGSTSEGAPFNRWVDGYPDCPEKPVTKCIGSTCMAWRWNDILRGSERVGKDTAKGHCGLAGKP